MFARIAPRLLAVVLILSLSTLFGFAATQNNPTIYKVSISPNPTTADVSGEDEVSVQFSISGAPAGAVVSWSCNGPGTISGGTYTLSKSEAAKIKTKKDVTINATVSVPAPDSVEGPSAATLTLMPDCACTTVGTGTGSNTSVDFNIAFGSGHYGSGAQSFWLKLETLYENATYSLRSLQWNRKLADAQPRNDTIYENGELRQLRHGGYLMDVQPLTEGAGYVLAAYAPSQVGAQPADLAPYLVNGEPFIRYVIRNPDPLYSGRLLIEMTDRTSGAPRNSQWLYTNSIDGDAEVWTMTRSVEGQVVLLDTLRRTAIPGTNFPTFVQVRTVEEAPSTGGNALKLVEQTRETYRWLLRDRKFLTERVEGYGTPEAKTTSWEYYEDPGSPLTFSFEKSKRTSEGFWEMYFYESGAGTSVRRVATGFENAAFGDIAHARVTQTTSSNIKVDTETRQTVREVETINGTLVNRMQTTRRILANGDSETVVAHSLPRGGANQELSVSYPTTGQGPERGSLRFRRNFDGSVLRKSYAAGPVSGAWTEIEDRGAGSEAAVTDGNRTTRKFNNHGILVEETIVDIASGVELSSRVADPASIDRFSRIGRWIYNNDPNDTSEVAYACCGVESEKARDGTRRLYIRDWKGDAIQTEVTNGTRIERTGYERDGLIQRQTVQAGGVWKVVATSVRNLAGNTVRQGQLAGNALNWEIADTELSVTRLVIGGWRETRTLPSGSTELTDFSADGQITQHVDQAGLVITNTRGVHAEAGGGVWEEIRKDGQQWLRKYIGLSGVLLRETRSAVSNQVAETVFETDSIGRLVRTTPPSGAPTLIFYNALGEPWQFVLDLNRTGMLEENGPDRVHRIKTRIMPASQVGGENLGPSKYTEMLVLNDAGQEVIAARQWESIDGLKNVQESHGVFEITRRTRATNGNMIVTTVAPDGTRKEERYINGRLIEALGYSQNAQEPLVHSINTYNQLGQLVSQTDRRHFANGTASDHVTQYSYYLGGQLATKTTPAGDITRYQLDIEGRKSEVTLPDGSKQQFAYDSAGRIRKVSGSQIYPTEYEYDKLGRQISLKTWQNVVNDATAAVTRWNYDPGSGLLLTKTYPDGNGIGYDYDTEGRLKRRTWARGIHTDYAYTAAGELAQVNYSDATPSVSYGYNRQGAPLAIGGYSYAYDAQTGDLLSETIPLGGDIERFRTLDRKRDVLGRDTGLRLKHDELLDHETSFSYDTAGRVNTISGRDKSFTATWVDGRPNLLGSVVGPVTDVTNVWEVERNVLIGKLNRTGTRTISSYTYEANSLGQRTTLQTAGEALVALGESDWTWTYNSKGELVTATNETNSARTKSFNYDDIGNRTLVSTGVLPNGGDVAYSNNLLNQFSQIQAAVVTNLLYDADGNLTDDGQLLYTWDAENRLVSITKKSDSLLLATYVYDHQNRRIRKTTSPNSVQGASDIAFLYDGWNLLAEYSMATVESASIPLRTYTWGLDLSSTTHGAGGIGGLLAFEEKIGANSGVYFPFYDGNGNLTEILTATGILAAHYEYGPFGEVLRATGPMANINRFRWSTKYCDEETGLAYYGYRYYDPSFGKWLGRDPIEEMGGPNLTAFVLNQPISLVDKLGLDVDPVVDSAWDCSGVTVKPLVLSPALPDWKVGPVTFWQSLKISGSLGVRHCKACCKETGATASVQAWALGAEVKYTASLQTLSGKAEATILGQQFGVRFWFGGQVGAGWSGSGQFQWTLSKDCKSLNGVKPLCVSLTGRLSVSVGGEATLRASRLISFDVGATAGVQGDGTVRVCLKQGNTGSLEYEGLKACLQGSAYLRFKFYGEINIELWGGTKCWPSN